MLQTKFISFDGLRVLVVDDNDDSLTLVEYIFNEYKALVKTATSVDKALELIENWQPDILVSDIGMPAKDGYILINHIRATEAKQEKFIPAIALTSHVYPEDIAKALNAGFQHVICKPFDPDELVISLAKLTQENLYKYI